MDYPTRSAKTNNARFSWLEDAGKDFPFYNGAPTPISGGQWLLVLAILVAGFLVLALPIRWPSELFAQIAPAVVMPLLPLLALAYVAPRHWTAIFGRVGARDVKLMIGFALLNILVSMSVGAIFFALSAVTSNAATARLGDLDAPGRILFFLKTVPQLFGEEVLTILPFLALMQLLWKGLAGKTAASEQPPTLRTCLPPSAAWSKS